jgi:hypothetical protein
MSSYDEFFKKLQKYASANPSLHSLIRNINSRPAENKEAFNHLYEHFRIIYKLDHEASLFTIFTRLQNGTFDFERFRADITDLEKVVFYK